MKRTALLLFATITALATITACTNDRPNPVDDPASTGDWYSLTDPLTGVELRCHVLEHRVHNGHSTTYVNFSEACYRP